MTTRTTIISTNSNNYVGEKVIKIFEDDIKDLIHSSCRMCSQSFYSTSHVPITVSCGHTYCKKCVKGPSGHVFICIICHRLMSPQFFSVKSNHQIRHLLELIKLVSLKSTAPSASATRLQLARRILSVNSRFGRLMEDFFKQIQSNSLDVRLQTAFLKILDSTEALKSYLYGNLKPRLLFERCQKSKIKHITFTKSDTHFIGAITCVVCRKFYNKTNRAPLSVACGHNFCWQCVQESRTKRLFNCPICRVVTITQRNALFPNELLIEMLESLKLLNPDDKKLNPMRTGYRRLNSEIFYRILNQYVPILITINKNFIKQVKFCPDDSKINRFSWHFVLASIHAVIDALKVLAV